MDEVSAVEVREPPCMAGLYRYGHIWQLRTSATRDHVLSSSVCALFLLIARAPCPRRPRRGLFATLIHTLPPVARMGNAIKRVVEVASYGFIAIAFE